MSTYQSTTMLFHVLATTAMVGVFWFVQPVHHPCFAAVGPGGSAQHEQLHHHADPASGCDRARVDRLARTNWVRTIGWSVIGTVAALIVVQVVSP